MTNEADNIAATLFGQCKSNEQRAELFRRFALELNRTHTFSDMVLLLVQAAGICPPPWTAPPRPKKPQSLTAPRPTIHATGEVKNP